MTCVSNTIERNALKGRKMVFRAFSTPFVFAQCKRGLSSPPVFLSAFQASARSNSFLSIFHILVMLFEQKSRGKSSVEMGA